MGDNNTQLTNIQELAHRYKNTLSERDYMALIKAVDKPLYVYINKYIDGYDRIRDVMSTVYETVWLKFDNYDESYQFTTWIFTIARNVAINYNRAYKKYWNLFKDESTIDEEYVYNMIDESNLREDLYNIVLDALMSIPESYSTAMYLKDIHDVPFVHISDMVNENMSTVRWRTFKARKDINKYILDKCPEFLECIREMQTDN